LSASFSEVGFALGVGDQYYGRNWQIPCLLHNKIYCFSQIYC